MGKELPSRALFPRKRLCDAHDIYKREVCVTQASPDTIAAPSGGVRILLSDGSSIACTTLTFEEARQLRANLAYVLGEHL